MRHYGVLAGFTARRQLCRKMAWAGDKKIFFFGEPTVTVIIYLDMLQQWLMTQLHAVKAHYTLLEDTGEGGTTMSSSLSW
jgi:hypothetical protein